MSDEALERKRRGANLHFRDKIRNARRGDKEAADYLLLQFARLSADADCFHTLGGTPDALVQYVATCIADWRRLGYGHADTWFFVERPSHRPAARVTRQEIQALRAYRLLMARGKGAAAALEGATASTGIKEDRVRYLVEKKDNDLERRVLSVIHPRLHPRILNPPRKKYQRSR
jgi:hypothetical protein